jgi:acyl dehydratase
VREYYFEDLRPGDKFSSPCLILTQEELTEYGRRYDPMPFHVDSTAAKASHFGGLVAAGLHTAALTWVLALKTGVFTKCGLAGMGIDELRWLKPVRPGDALTCRFEILETRLSLSKPDRGIAVVRHDLFNQNNEIVFTMRTTHLLSCRPSDPA